MNLIETNWKDTNCPICDSKEYLSLLSREHAINQRFNKYKFLLKDVICENCGHIYERNIPEIDFLDKYYGEAFTRKSDIVNIKPDFNIDNRLSLLDKYLINGQRVLEIGANDGFFINILKKHGYDASGFDPLNTEDTFDDVEKVFFDGSKGLGNSNNQVDAVISYYVLEHITTPKKWISEITESLKEDGIIVMEVPDFRKFPRESLLYEHFQHFSDYHLTALLNTCGFEVLEVTSNLVSRYFGIVIVGKKTSKIVNQVFDREEYNVNHSIYLENQRNETKRSELFNKMSLEIVELRDSILSNNKKAPIYFWGANDISEAFSQRLKQYSNLSNVHIIDSSSEKNGMNIAGFETQVQYPMKVPESNTIPIFIICSFNYFDQINEMIEKIGYESHHIYNGTIPFHTNFI